jgi:hypothetical protein
MSGGGNGKGVNQIKSNEINPSILARHEKVIL